MFYREIRMLRTLSSACIDSQRVSRRYVFKLFRLYAHSSGPNIEPTVFTSEGTKAVKQNSHASRDAPAPPAPPAPPPPRAPRSWATAAALTALTASLGGVYLYRKMNGDIEDTKIELSSVEQRAEEEAPSPADAASLPAHVQFLLLGGGTASFAAMRAIRSARPDAQVLIVAAEHALPYMRPPLSKELWREPDLAAAARSPDALAFRQWNGRRRSVAYEPSAFYAPPERLRDGAPGAALARGWRATSLDPARRAVRLDARGASHSLTYDQCLIATGARPRRVPALRAAAAAGRSLALRGVRDAARLAAALDDPAVRAVAVVGGGLLATELAVALADRLRERGTEVVQICREAAPLAELLPRYLADDVARRMREAGVALRAGAEVAEAELVEGGLRLRLSSGESVAAQLAVECAGSEPETELAAAAGLELHAALGGVLVNAELQARSGVFAAGDVACFYDEALGRRRVEHHDHAVVTGRLAGENMAALAPPRPYTHQSMFWSDLGPRLGYEAVGIIDSKLATVGVFSADAVGDETAVAVEAGAVTESGAGAGAGAAAGAAAGAGAGAGAGASGEAPRRFERGVVFYVRERRVVGVLLWNLFNRMQVARQVLKQGEFDDLFEVAKLFTPHEEE